jgi:hypothetical protein
MMAWVSLLGSDPLIDPWENTSPRIAEIEITAFYEPSDSAAWSLDDNELLNPFEQEER